MVQNNLLGDEEIDIFIENVIKQLFLLYIKMG